MSEETKGQTMAEEGEINEEEMEEMQGGGGYQSPYQGQNSYENAADHGVGGARPR